MSTTLCVSFNYGDFDPSAKYHERMEFIELLQQEKYLLKEPDADTGYMQPGHEERGFRPADPIAFHKRVENSSLESKEVLLQLAKLLIRNPDLWLSISY